MEGSVTLLFASQSHVPLLPAVFPPTASDLLLSPARPIYLVPLSHLGINLEGFGAGGPLSSSGIGHESTADQAAFHVLGENKPEIILSSHYVSTSNSSRCMFSSLCPKNAIIIHIFHTPTLHFKSFLLKLWRTSPLRKTVPSLLQHQIWKDLYATTKTWCGIFKSGT